MTIHDAEYAYHVEEYHEYVNLIAERLEQAAADVRRRGTAIRPLLHDTLPHHMDAAVEVLTTINSLAGNMPTAGLVRHAAAADRIARRPE